jgi:hypothetical protein
VTVYHFSRQVAEDMRECSRRFPETLKIFHIFKIVVIYYFYRKLLSYAGLKIILFKMMSSYLQVIPSNSFTNYCLVSTNASLNCAMRFFLLIQC